MFAPLRLGGFVRTQVKAPLIWQHRANFSLFLTFPLHAHRRVCYQGINKSTSPSFYSTSAASKKFPFPFLDFDLMGGVGSRPAVNMSSTQAKFVKDTIANNKVAIFSKSYCPYCTMAKEQFRKLNIQPTVVELDGNPEANEIQSILGEITGATTVPRVFIDGKFIGGGTDVKRMYEQGALQKHFQ